MHPPDDAVGLEPAGPLADAGDVADPVRRAGGVAGDAGAEPGAGGLGQGRERGGQERHPPSLPAAPPGRPGSRRSWPRSRTREVAPMPRNAARAPTQGAPHHACRPVLPLDSPGSTVVRRPRRQHQGAVGRRRRARARRDGRGPRPDRAEHGQRGRDDAVGQQPPQPDCRRRAADRAVQGPPGHHEPRALDVGRQDADVRAEVRHRHQGRPGRGHPLPGLEPGRRPRRARRLRHALGDLPQAGRRRAVPAVAQERRGRLAGGPRHQGHAAGRRDGQGRRRARRVRGDGRGPLRQARAGQLPQQPGPGHRAAGRRLRRGPRPRPAGRPGDHPGADPGQGRVRRAGRR